YALILLFALRLVFLTAVEKKYPAHEVSYRKALPRDLLATLVCTFAVLPAADYLNKKISFQLVLPDWISDWPLAVRIMLYLVIADFGHYWVHRLLHTRHLWCTHKWHHSPTYMYWLPVGGGSVFHRSVQNNAHT